MLTKLEGHIFQYLHSLARVIDQPEGMLKLYRNGVNIGCIQPQTNDYQDRRDILERFQWENYPYVEYDGSVVMWIDGDIVITFDSFEEYWI